MQFILNLNKTMKSVYIYVLFEPLFKIKKKITSLKFNFSKTKFLFFKYIFYLQNDNLI